ncbi:MAG: tyrosine--tRNA ligase [Candidatus Marsarchaeota archaeon]|nr:tyrosine--tRNA ligase [Candidatus Marsarchaeota archaeon]MCL5094430.1 tyrosine--tRNA ligase [Candidatus Marsarchaeota archaeon]
MNELELIKRAPIEELLTEQKLKDYLETNKALKHYIGFEISGFVHFGTGLLSMEKLADFQEAGVDTNVFLADYHTWINKKLGGDLSTIRKIGGTYFKEALKKSLEAVGGNPEKVKFIMGSELYDKLGTDYLEDVIKISKKMTLARAKRSITVAGRKEGESVSFGQLLYVPMQVADIYGLKVNLAHAGMDQRKAHVVALEVAKEFDYEPIAIHHHLLTGVHINKEQRAKIITAKDQNNRELLEQQLIEVKMSKSKPESAIFIHDSEEVIRKKINSAYCPTKETKINPIIDISNYIVFPYLIRKNMTFEIVNKKTNKSSTYKYSSELEDLYQKGEIHPLDLKEAIANYLVDMLEPTRKYFLEGNGKKYLEGLQDIKITR